MAAQSVASRTRRPPGVTDVDDAFIARTLEFTAWARRNARLVIAIAVLALLLIGGLVYYRMYQANRMERAATEFMFIEQTVATNLALATTDLEQFVQRFDGTPYADEARVMLGRIRMEAGEAPQAVAALAPLEGRMRRSPVGVQGVILLGDARLAAGDTTAAIDTYVRAAEGARNDFFREEALSAAALLREERGDYTGAAELYQRIIAFTEEGSFERSLYEMRLAEVQGRALGR